MGDGQWTQFMSEAVKPWKTLFLPTSLRQLRSEEKQISVSGNLFNSWPKSLIAGRAVQRLFLQGSREGRVKKRKFFPWLQRKSLKPQFLFARILAPAYL